MEVQRPRTTQEVIVLLQSQTSLHQWEETRSACLAMIDAIKSTEGFDPDFQLDTFHAVGIVALIQGFDEGRDAAANARPHIVRLSTTRDPGSHPDYEE